MNEKKTSADPGSFLPCLSAYAAPLLLLGPDRTVKIACSEEALGKGEKR